MLPFRGVEIGDMEHDEKLELSAMSSGGVTHQQESMAPESVLEIRVEFLCTVHS